MNHIVSFRWWCFLCVLTCILLTGCERHGASESIRSGSYATVEAIEVVPVFGDEGETTTLQLRAALNVHLDEELVNAAAHGVPLAFVFEAKLRERSWFFWQRTVQQSAREWVIHYQPLLRQWSVDNGQRITQELSLEDSLEQLMSEAFLSLPIDTPLAHDKSYELALRLHLDASRSPGAFQFNLFNIRSAWSLTSEWQRIMFQPSATALSE